MESNCPKTQQNTKPIPELEHANDLIVFVSTVEGGKKLTKLLGLDHSTSEGTLKVFDFRLFLDSFIDKIFLIS